MKIFGIGMPKTGFTTLGECFKMLGYSHRPWNSDNAVLLEQIQQGDFTEVFQIIEKYDTFKGNPWLQIYKILD